MASEPSSDWIAAVTRPFDDHPELQLAAHQELTERGTNADPEQLAKIAKRFDAIDRSSPKKRALLHWLPIALAFLLTLAAALSIVLPYLNIRSMVGSTFLGPAPHAQANALRSHLSPADHFAIFGDTTQPTEELAIKALWQSDPDNPVLYNHYLNHCETSPENLGMGRLEAEATRALQSTLQSALDAKP